ncbi:MAG: AAA family ATPase [Chloroflexi bacterium]|nr:AAA family ATPase [Chloroflexota bacterium]
MFIKSLHIKGMLSFQEMSLEMRPLNVLIGPNASGKSNLIEIIALLQSLPRDLTGFISASGGINEWLWKGNDNGLIRSGRIDAVFDNPTLPNPTFTKPLCYGLQISSSFPYMTIVEEFLENEQAQSLREPYRHFQVREGSGKIWSKSWLGENEREIRIRPSWEEWIPRDEQKTEAAVLTRGHSVLREIRDPVLYPEISSISNRLDYIHLYREWNMGRNSGIRKPQQTDIPNFYLLEDFSNLALVLNRMQRLPVFREIEENLRKFYELYDQVGVMIQANTAQLWLREKGLQDVIPASRLSDGTLRYLALLTILCHPTPPPLVCIEEPELGLHPELIPELGRLLISASERTQLIVTTHSRSLIDRLWEDVESVVVCERDFDSGSEFKRLSEDKLEKWLERYELGELWGKGVLGGNRW